MRYAALLVLLLVAGCSAANNRKAATAPPAPATRAATAPAVSTPTASVPVATNPATTAPAAAASGHTWYTSSASNAREFYCDDDAGWKALAAGNLRQFPTVAQLLAAYPGRTLHQPCGDGATGP